MIMNKSSRRSKNVIDIRSPKDKERYETKQTIGEKHLRMIYRPDVESQMVKYGNKKLGQLKAGEAMKSPAKTSGATKFLKHTVKKGK